MKVCWLVIHIDLHELYVICKLLDACGLPTKLTLVDKHVSAIQCMTPMVYSTVQSLLALLSHFLFKNEVIASPHTIETDTKLVQYTSKFIATITSYFMYIRSNGMHGFL